MITLIGTGHVFNLSKSITAVFDEKNPDVICVELDKQRYRGLLQKKTNPSSVKQKQKNLPMIYTLLARFQDSMANQYGVSAGDEMMTAITYAQSQGIPLQLIDMQAQQLFITMWKTMPFFEKLKLLLSGFTGIFVSKKRVEEELKTFQQNSDTYFKEIGKQFPTIKKTLIDDRNEYMAKKIMTLNQNYQSIMVCVGDGHIQGISKILQKNNIDFETIRLAELRDKPIKEYDGSSAHFTTHYKAID
jgi:pheromone shutdown-related protein TraB